MHAGHMASFKSIFFFCVVVIRFVQPQHNYQQQQQYAPKIRAPSPNKRPTSTGGKKPMEQENPDNIFELIIPKNDPTNACIKMNASFHFSVTYQAQSVNGTVTQRTVNFTLTERDNFTFTGLCRPEKNMLELQFLTDWRLELYFYRTPETFLFNHVVLYYKLSGLEALFPGAVHAGAQSELYDATFINSTISKSYKCLSGVEIDLNEVRVYMRNLTLEPFFNKRPNLPLDPAEECPQDRHSPVDTDATSVWILVAVCIVLAVAVCSCTWFICYKIRSDYLAIKSDKEVLRVRV